MRESLENTAYFGVPKTFFSGRGPNCDNNFIEKISKTILACVDKFAPLITVKLQHISNDWIANEIEKAITKRDNYFIYGCNRQVALIKICTRDKGMYLHR